MDYTYQALHDLEYTYSSLRAIPTSDLYNYPTIAAVDGPEWSVGSYLLYIFHYFETI